MGGFPFEIFFRNDDNKFGMHPVIFLSLKIFTEGSVKFENLTFKGTTLVSI